MNDSCADSGITVICRQPLTAPYIEEKIKALPLSRDHMTARFVQLYGEAQRAKTVEWFERARHEL